MFSIDKVSRTFSSCSDKKKKKKRKKETCFSGWDIESPKPLKRVLSSLMTPTIIKTFKLEGKNVNVAS